MNARPDLEIEKSLAAFVTPKKRPRFRLLVEGRKARDKIRLGLAHSHDWDSRFMQPIRGTPQQIHSVLREMGAPTECHILSENDRDVAISSKRLR